MKTLSEFIDFNPSVALEKGCDYSFVGMERIQPGVRYVQSKECRAFIGGGARFSHEDTLFARITPCLENGKIAQFVAEPGICGFGSTEFFILRAKQGISDPSFVYYLAQTDEVRNTAIQSMVGASGRQRADINSLKTLTFALPEVDKQQEIGQILSTYDDLIENNRRRIALLEESARLLYREWFIKLRFPGHESVKWQDGLPEGWRKCYLKDIATLNYGKALKESDRVAGDVPVYGSSGIVGTHDKPLIDGPVIIVGRKGNVGSVFFSDVPCFAIDTVYFISGLEVNYYLFQLLQTMNFISSDSAVPGLNRNYAYGLEVLYPDKSTLLRFEETIATVFQQISLLKRQNIVLQNARDELLPRLMSGAVQV